MNRYDIALGKKPRPLTLGEEMLEEDKKWFSLAQRAAEDHRERRERNEIHNYRD
jgi:hypothetical protein